MAFRLEFLGSCFLILAALSFCHGKGANVKLVGTISCADCLKQELSSSEASSGLSVTLHCKTRNSETHTLGKGSVNRDGKFNIILSAENIEENKSNHRCYAMLHSAVAAASCPVRTAKTATMKIVVSTDNATKATQTVHKTIKFSPVTCQSAFFWHFFNFPPHPDFTLPSPETPEVYAPSPPPTPSASTTPDLPPLSPSTAPALAPPSPTNTDLFPPPLPPAFLPPTRPASSPQVQEPNQPTPSPVPPFNPEQSSPSLPPILAPEPHHSSPIPPPSRIGTLTPPVHRVPNPIPRAPPVPQLPPVPAVPRKHTTSKSLPSD